MRPLSCEFTRKLPLLSKREIERFSGGNFFVEDGEKGIHYSACESLKRSPSIGVDRVNFRKGGSEVISRYVRSRIEDVVGRRWG